MKATMSKDGKRRINLNILIRLDADLLATLIVSHKHPYKEDTTVEAFVAEVTELSNRALLEMARAEIRSSGEETPWYRVGDAHLEDYAIALAKALEPRFFAETLRPSPQRVTA